MLFISRSVGTSKEEDAGDEGTSERPTRIRPLYDIPYMFEAREFLRKKLIGKKAGTLNNPRQNSMTSSLGASVHRLYQTSGEQFSREDMRDGHYRRNVIVAQQYSNSNHIRASISSNVAEALISKGFATVIRHRQDDNQRSSKYDDLLAAESR